MLNYSNDDVNSTDGIDSMASMNSVDSVDKAVVIESDINSDGITIGLTFYNKSSAVAQCTTKTYCPLIKARRERPNNKTKRVEKLHRQTQIGEKYFLVISFVGHFL